MAKLTTTARSKLPSAAFAGPGRSYPVPDKAHAANAKARATQQVKAGNLAPSTAAKIDAKANKVLKKSPARDGLGKLAKSMSKRLIGG